MSGSTTRITTFAGAVAAAAALFTSPVAGAYEPQCAAGEKPYQHGCRSACAGGAPTIGSVCTQPGTDLYDRGFHEPTHEGANPRMPYGTNPQVPEGTHTNITL